MKIKRQIANLVTKMFVLFWFISKKMTNFFLSLSWVVMSFFGFAPVVGLVVVVVVVLMVVVIGFIKMVFNMEGCECYSIIQPLYHPVIVEWCVCHNSFIQLILKGLITSEIKRVQVQYSWAGIAYTYAIDLRNIAPELFLVKNFWFCYGQSSWYVVDLLRFVLCSKVGTSALSLTWMPCIVALKITTSLLAPDS
jgi:hypothetical protein